VIDRNLLLRAAMTSALAIAGSTISLTSNAANGAKLAMEQCAGVIKAGKNDCATSTNACHGHVESDASPEAWIYVPKGTCDRIIGARVVVVKVPPPKK
jgi:uncharacterized membrane protein